MAYEAINVIQTLNSYLDQAAQDHEFNGNIPSCARTARALYKRSYGYRDIANQVPLDDSTLFRFWHPFPKRLRR